MKARAVNKLIYNVANELRIIYKSILEISQTKQPQIKTPKTIFLEEKKFQWQNIP